jgi:predicted glutamine amidotransferase
MCLIIHKPAGTAIPATLVEAAVHFNSDGWGAMGFAADGRMIITRWKKTQASDIRQFADTRIDDELVLHLRYRTRGAADAYNVQPFEIVPGWFLMHNGEVDVPRRLADRSDTWHLVTDVMRPLLQRYPNLALDRRFLHIFEQSLGPDNRVVLMSRQARRIDILNAAQGINYNGLWLSGTRWIDHTVLEIPGAPQPQRRSYHATGLHFA